jgi:hypothetical protein
MLATITHIKSNTIGDFTGTVTLFNSAGTTVTALATDLVRPSDWNSNHSVQITMQAADIASLFNFARGLSSSTSTNGISVGISDINFYEPFPLHNTNSTISAPGIGTWYIEPFNLPFAIVGGGLNFFANNAAGFLNGAVFSATSTGSASKVQSLSHNIAIYKRGTSTASTRLESVWTGVWEARATQSLTMNGTTSSALTVTNALTLSYPVSVGSDGAMTYGTTSQSGSTSVGASTGASTLANNVITGAVAYLSGSRMDVLGLNTTLNAGQYWLAHMWSSSSASSGTRYTAGTMFSTQSVLGLLENNLGGFKGNGLSVSNTSTNAIPFKGFLNTTTASATSNMNNADIRYTTGRIYWNYDGDAYP